MFSWTYCYKPVELKQGCFFFNKNNISTSALSGRKKTHCFDSSYLSLCVQKDTSIILHGLFFVLIPHLEELYWDVFQCKHGHLIFQSSRGGAALQGPSGRSGQILPLGWQVQLCEWFNRVSQNFICGPRTKYKACWFGQGKNIRAYYSLLPLSKCACFFLPGFKKISSILKY